MARQVSAIAARRGLLVQRMLARDLRGALQHLRHALGVLPAEDPARPPIVRSIEAIATALDAGAALDIQGEG